MRKRRSAYQGVRNVSFLQAFMLVLRNSEEASKILCLTSYAENLMKFPG